MTTTFAEPIDSVTWRHYGLCRNQWDLFDGFTQADVDEAVAKCRRCPVLSWCREDVRNRTDRPIGVIAGVLYER